MTDLVILAGGFGTRLKLISNGIPKALMPVSNSVYLDLLVNRIMHFNVKHIFLSLHYKPELFIDHIKGTDYRDFVTPIVEPEPLGTGGAINYVVQNSSITSTFFVINGDSLSDINLDHMKTAFENCSFKTILGVSQVKNKKRYGTVIFNNQTVTSFKEKGVITEGWINNGHYIIYKDIFTGYGRSFSLEKILFPELMKNQQLGVFQVYNDDFIDMGIPEDYIKLCRKFEVTN